MTREESVSLSERASRPETGERFGRAQRIRRGSEYKAIYAGGRRVRLRSATLFLMPAGEPEVEGTHSRLGITVTRRIGNSVVRNRLKRRVREIFRRHRATIRKDLLIVVNVAPPAVSMPYAEIEREILGALR